MLEKCLENNIFSDKCDIFKFIEKSLKNSKYTKCTKCANSEKFSEKYFHQDSSEDTKIRVFFSFAS